MFIKFISVFIVIGIAIQSQADTFSPIQGGQAPTGDSYPLVQPRLESPTLFQGKHVAILASHGVEHGEITYPYDYLVARGAQVDIVVPSWAVSGITVVSFLQPVQWAKATTTFKAAQSVQYDLLVLTGGAWNSQVVRADADALKLISDHYKAGLPIAAICSGTSVLINAGIAGGGQRLTGSPPVMTDLINAGATFVDAPLVMGDHLVTSRTPNDLPEFVRGIRILLLGY